MRGWPVAVAVVLVTGGASAAARSIQWEVTVHSTRAAPRKLAVPTVPAGSRALDLGLHDWSCVIARSLIGGGSLGTVEDAVTITCVSKSHLVASTIVSCEVTDEETSAHGFMSVGELGGPVLSFIVDCANY